MTLLWYLSLFVWLILLSIIFCSSALHVAVNGRISFFFMIFLCVCLSIYTTSSLSIQFVDGHLGCFHILAIVSSTAVKIAVHVSFWNSVFIFFLDVYSEVELLDHKVILFLVFWRPSKLFSIMAASVYLPTNNVQGFSLLPVVVVFHLPSSVQLFATP